MTNGAVSYSAQNTVGKYEKDEYEKIISADEFLYAQAVNDFCRRMAAKVGLPKSGF